MIFHSVAGALFIMQVLASAFLAVLFLQSGIDKVTDRRGNLDWLTGHFAKKTIDLHQLRSSDVISFVRRLALQH